MLRSLAFLQVPKHEITASLIGGANVLRGFDPNRSVGYQNVDIARKTLERHGILVSHQNIGGTLGRTLTYATDTGKIKVRLHQA